MKKLFKLIWQVLILYGFYYVGLFIRNVLHLSVPSSVIGMLLLFLFLMLRGIKVEWIDTGAQFFVDHLVFFFIPATVGVMNYFGLFKGHGMWLIIITVVSSFLVMLTSGHMSQALARKRVVEHD
ncbi:CidA/LrgA family protein [Cerasibacillus terrae]|uniref:CidA/LrgA family protein n=1 Tax=Cerasibacillus terrae TaxID=2498845 RepID=A0A5C8NDI4_9BACI|nr:CidA/LrgA family protein [Cerasibacillus terrae]TXL57562.1 CidA/LrgA family protein [Cerasibacillus terrae]